MSLLLHLSDLHLGNSTAEDAVGDHKVEAVPEPDRVTRLALMRTTLAALAAKLTHDGDELAAVLVTGDVTTRGRAEGFQALPGLLQALGDRLPPNDRIVVVPGNHDVAWHTEPGSPDRYRQFLEHVRAAGYVTPLLDGLDYDGDDPRPAAAPLLVGDDFVVAAVNSSDLSGVLEPFAPPAQAQLDALAAAGGHQELLAEIGRVRTYDMSRVSGRQMSALAARLATVGDGRVRIAALHHQLVPVSDEEEAKAFETMTNLGAFTSFLGEAEVDVVVHGHKHVEATRPLALSGPSGRPRAAVVSSCGTVGGQTGVGREIARLVRVSSDLPTLRRVEIISVPAVGAGTARLTDERLTTVHEGPIWPDGPAAPVAVVGGTTAAQVHEQLVDLAAPGRTRPPRDVLCFVEQGPSALEPPPTYPWTLPPEGLRPWFEDIVGWWQDPARAPGKPFTHGQRLRDWSAAGRDQVDALVAVLAAKASTSRAIAVLVDPLHDRVEDTTSDFPSFALLHLWVEQGRLHCTAFFRKQEMRFWWAINAAEVARVQQEVVLRLRLLDVEVAPGSIRTYASEAVFSDRLPKVNVPRVDRLTWSAPHDLLVLAVAVAGVGATDPTADLAAAAALLDDWEPVAPEPPADGAPAPVHGLRALSEAVSALVDRHPEGASATAAGLLRDIVEANDSYRQGPTHADPLHGYRQWRERVLPKIDRLRALLLTPR